MNETTISPNHESETMGLLDILLVLAENLRLLILGPLVVGLIALGLTFLLPKKYESTSVLQSDVATASMVTTATVLDPVITDLGLAGDLSMQEARAKLIGQIQVATGRTDKLMTLTVTAESPEGARALNDALLKRLFVEVKPKGTARDRLQGQLTETRMRYDNAKSASNTLFKRLDSVAGVGGSGSAEVVRGYAELLGTMGVAQARLAAIEIELEGLNPSQLVQSPTLPQQAVSPKKAVIAVTATVIAGLVMLVFVFARNAWVSGSADAGVRAKLDRIRRGFGFR